MASFLGTGGDNAVNTKVAGEFLYSLPTFSSEHGGSLKLRTTWNRHVDNLSKGTDYVLYSGNGKQKDRQEVLLVKKNIPAPVKFAYVGNTLDYFSPIIDLTFNIEKMAKQHKVTNKQLWLCTLDSAASFTKDAIITQTNTDATAKVWKTTSSSTTVYLYNLSAVALEVWTAGVAVDTLTSSDGGDATGKYINTATIQTNTTLRRSFNICFATAAPQTGDTFVDYIKRLDDTANNNYNFISIMSDDAGQLSVWPSGFNDSGQKKRQIDIISADEGPFESGVSSDHNDFSIARNGVYDLITGTESPISNAGEIIEIGKSYKLQISPSVTKTNASNPFFVYRISEDFEGLDTANDTTNTRAFEVPCSSSTHWSTFKPDGFGDSNTSWPSVMTVWLCNQRPLKFRINTNSDSFSAEEMRYSTGWFNATYNGIHAGGAAGSLLGVPRAPIHFATGPSSTPAKQSDAIDLETGAGIKEFANTESIIYLSKMRFKDFNLDSKNASKNSEQVSSTIAIPSYSEKAYSTGGANSWTAKANPSFLFYGVNTSTYMSGDGNAKYVFFNNHSTNNSYLASHISDANIKTGYSHSENSLGDISNQNTYDTGTSYNGLDYDAGTVTSTASDAHVTGRGTANDIESFTQRGFLKFEWPISGLNGGDDGASFIKRENPLFSARVVSVEATGADSTSVIVDNPPVFNNALDEDYIVYKYGGRMTDDISGVNGYPVCGTANKPITAIFQSNPAVVTASGHSMVTGDMVLIEDVVGMTQVNDTYFHVTYVDANSFSLTGIDSTGFTAYGSAGVARHCSPDFRIVKVLDRTGDKINFNSSCEFGEYYYNGGNITDSFTSNRSHASSSNLISSSRYHDVLISPFRYWIFQELTNRNYTGDISNPSSIYGSAFITAGVGTPGTTFREWNYSDSRTVLYPWDLSPTNGTIIEMGKDYGFGSYADTEKEGSTTSEDNVGFLSVLTNPSINSYEEFNMPKIVEADSPNFGDDLTLFLTPFSLASQTLTMHSRTGTYPPLLVSVFEDELPNINEFTVKPNEENPFFPEFTWECGDDDIWYGFIIVSERGISNQYHNSILHFPLNEKGTHASTAAKPFEKIANSISAVDTPVCKYDLEGLGGYCLRFDGTDDYIKYGTGSETWTANLSEASFVAHIIPDSSSSQEYILNQTGTVFIRLTSGDKIQAQLNWDADSFIQLESTSLITRDGEMPTNVIVTFDKYLTTGNAKLYINGKLEDQTGRALLADEVSPGTGSTGWKHYEDLGSTGSNYLFIGNDTASGECFEGRLEEIVVYNKAIYPFTGNTTNFIFTKPLPELADTSHSAPKSYAAKIFLKDYHNIRGTTTKEVGTSPQISFRKAGFFLDNS